MKQALKHISYSLIQQGLSVPNVGLLHGKIGIVIFLFHYARFSRDKLFEDSAIILMNSLLNENKQRLVVNYANGLAGIGVGVEYLVKNKFIELNTNEVLNYFDKRIFYHTVCGGRKDLSLFTGLSGLGRYLLFRVSKDDHISTLNNKMLLIHITDTLERIYSSLEDADTEDVLRFLYGMNQTNIYPVKVKRLITLFSSHTPSSNQNKIMYQYRIKHEALYHRRYNDFLSEIQENKQSCMVPDLYGGLAGIGLYLLSQLDNQHETWMKLL